MFHPVDLKNRDYPHDFPAPSRESLTSALDGACEKLLRNIGRWQDVFPKTCGAGGRYGIFERPFNWESGMLTGCYLLAYGHTGEKTFLETARRHVSIFADAAERNEGLNDHDTGFIFQPSAVALYRLTGDDGALRASLRAADILLDHYDKDAHFIIRSGKRHSGWYPGFRTLVDSMMNIPLFFFASEATGDHTYRDAAIAHYHTTMQYLIREDGSSFHHYQFDPETLQPVGGVTLQGHADSSCWGRGHAWLLYGFPIAYAYTGDPDTVSAHNAVTKFFLDRLPSDAIPYWDFDFTEGSAEPRDSSIGAIAYCGFTEMARLRPDAETAALLRGKANEMLTALIAGCADPTDETDGLIRHVTHAVPQGEGIDQCAVYGDYFYMEALTRALYPDRKWYW